MMPPNANRVRSTDMILSPVFSLPPRITFLLKRVEQTESRDYAGNHAEITLQQKTGATRPPGTSI
jgi:hypothetical protein